MKVQKYKVTCLKCKGFNIVPIGDDRKVMWDNTDRIISARFRLDNNWGFQCICGNNNLLTEQEDSYIEDKQTPDPKQISDVIKNLKPDTRKLFEMRVV